MIPNLLSIAGSDPSGGAGIQADLKTISALGGYGMAAITALTAQNTQGVAGVYEVPAEFVLKQVQTIFDDVRVDAIKIGMAGSPDTIHALAEFLKIKNPPLIVLDPVMVAQSGDTLLSKQAIAHLKNELLPLASIITPNIPEAEILLGRNFDGDMEKFAVELLALGAPRVLLKGGHLNGEISIDIYADAERLVRMEDVRIDTKNNHGTGCTLSSALATFMAKGLSANEASAQAKDYITKALKASSQLSVGQGAGPVHHFHGLWP